MEQIFLNIYSQRRKESCKMGLDDVVYYRLAALDIWDMDYSPEVIKSLAVLERSRIMKEVKNSKYAVISKRSIELDESCAENIGDEIKNSIKRAIAETKGMVAISGEKTVELFYTRCCGGGTANSEDILGYRINYLRKVLCKHCSQEYIDNTIPIGEFARKLNIREISHKEEVAGVIREVERDETGRILSVNFMGQKMSGEEFANFFNTPSNRIYFVEDSIVFRSVGRGMGLGMCLEGAEKIANQGGNFKDIIKYYYTGVDFDFIDESNLCSMIIGKKIALDPGHGGDDLGNISGEIYEKNANLKITEVLRDMLKGIGADVILTRNDDINIPMSDRVGVINNFRPEIFISIHQNSFMFPGVNGVEVYCYDGDNEAMKLGKIILENISNIAGIKNRGVRTGDYYILRECKRSGILIECMYMSGDKDKLRYNEGTYLLIAEAIYKSLCQYYEIEPGIF